MDRTHGRDVAVLDELISRYVSDPAGREAIASLLRRITTPTLEAATFPFDDDPSAASVPLGPRYEDLGLLGVGGMGEVRRVRDRELERVIAMKIVRAASSATRFVHEAQVTAQLQHPGIPPVHELGRLPDGRSYFTMREIRGRTLAEVAFARAGQPGFRRRIDLFSKVCEAVAYAHARGVVHRDLKPHNVMIGEHGEVLVVDWGLAKLVGTETPPDDAIVSGRVRDALVTRAGAVAGTPAYMPPEQARGDRVDLRWDVYALGAILFELLWGEPPYGVQEDGNLVLASVLAGPPEEPQADAPPPEELVVVCRRAMARDPADRFPDARALADEIAAWLDGAHKRERALHVVTQAAAQGPAAEALRARARQLRDAAALELLGVRAWEPEDRKRAAWALEDEAIALEREAARRELEADRLLHAALTHAPDLPEAHAALADRYRQEAEAAERSHDAHAADRALARLQEHVGALPAEHADRARHQRWLRGDGALTVHTDPPGAEVLLHRFVVRDRRLVAEPVRPLGRTPLVGVPLATGSWLLELRAHGHEVVRYPVRIRRAEHWDGVPPGAREPVPVRLPRVGDLGPDDVYVPAGWAELGGDPEAFDPLPATRVWVDALVIRRFAVTNREYIAFLDDLVARGRAEDAIRFAPWFDAGEPGSLVYGRDADGRFVLRPDPEGDTWLPDYAVVLVDHACARAYASWLAAREGRPWRLLGELEWEKGARGVDGRFFPWGDQLDPSWTRMRDSHDGRPLPGVVGSHPVDESPYGVRGCGGNVRCWTDDLYRPEGPPIAGRVGAPAARWPWAPTRGGRSAAACGSGRSATAAAPRARPRSPATATRTWGSAWPARSRRSTRRGWPS